MASVIVASGVTAPVAVAQSSSSNLSELSSYGSSFLPKELTNGTIGTTYGGNLINGTAAGRSYKAFIPAGYDSSKAYPVIIGMGGWQHSNDTFRGYAGLESEVGNEAIVLYPQAAITNGEYAWGGAPYSNTTVSQDANAIRAAVNDLASNYSINRSKVFAVGLSNGGGMALGLACQAPDLVAGVAGVAGAYYNPTTNGCSSTPVPTLIMHAPNDDIVSYNGGVRHGAPYRSVDAVMRQFQSKNRCVVNGISGVGTTGIGTVTVKFSNCAATTTHIRVNNGGHTWFPNLAQREAWNFFKAQL